MNIFLKRMFSSIILFGLFFSNFSNCMMGGQDQVRNNGDQIENARRERQRRFLEDRARVDGGDQDRDLNQQAPLLNEAGQGNLGFGQNFAPRLGLQNNLQNNHLQGQNMLANFGIGRPGIDGFSRRFVFAMLGLGITAGLWWFFGSIPNKFFKNFLYKSDFYKVKIAPVEKKLSFALGFVAVVSMGSGLLKFIFSGVEL